MLKTFGSLAAALSLLVQCACTTGNESGRDTPGPVITASTESGPIPPGSMAAYCRGEAYAAFSVRPQDLVTSPVERSADGYTIRGQSPPPDGQRARTFQCKFDTAGAFQSIQDTSAGSTPAASSRRGGLGAGGGASAVEAGADGPLT